MAGALISGAVNTRTRLGGAAGRHEAALGTRTIINQARTCALYCRLRRWAGAGKRHAWHARCAGLGYAHRQRAALGDRSDLIRSALRASSIVTAELPRRCTSVRATRTTSAIKINLMSEVMVIDSVIWERNQWDFNPRSQANARATSPL